jgi:transposase InsO family protein
MQTEKIETVQKWPTPRNLHDVRSFLGLCSYYRRFISGFADIAAPLHALAGKGVHFVWQSTHQKAFDELKRSLTTAPVLAMPDNESPYLLDTDASDTGLGAILSQVQNGEERVIAYASRTLQKPERNYETTRKELLAVVYGLKQFKQYLLGRPIAIRVDHAALTWLRKTPEPMPQLARWLTFIEQFDYTVVHRAGKRHSNADSLSRRRESDSVDGDDSTPAETVDVGVLAVQLPVPDVADPLAGENLATAQQEDDEIGKVIQMRLQGDEQPPIETLLAESAAAKIVWSNWSRLAIVNGVVGRRLLGKNGRPDSFQLILPYSLRHEAIRRCHTGMTGGHLGTKKTLNQVQRRFFWPTWRRDTARYCRLCPECNEYHRGKLPRSGPLQPIIAGAPFERLSIDLTGPHCKSDRGHIWILTCIDPFTKWVEAFPLRNKESETVAKVLVEQVITRFGTPIALLSDRGNEVDSSIMRAVCRLLDIDKLHTTAYKASTNAAIERFHKTLNSMLGKLVRYNQRDWDLHLPFVMAAYRASRHESTGYSPNLLTLGREVRAPIDVVMDLPNPDGPAETYDGYVDKLQNRMREAYKFVRQEIGRAAERNKRYYDLRVRRKKYSIGDWVYYFNPRHYRGRQDKWCRKFSGPFLVIGTPSPVNVTLQRTCRAKPFVTHIDKVKPYLADTPRSWLEDPSQPTAVTADEAGRDKSSIGPSDAADTTVDSTADVADEAMLCDDETIGDAVLFNESTADDSEDEEPGPVDDEAEGRDESFNVPPDFNASPETQPNINDEIAGEYAVDEARPPRPRREIRLPARYRD